ncbi:leucyl/phenylalanyl-tRNA--protein transferase [Nocardia brasiliensis]|uniref:leucyl/phenylalanyl-tRNA--protein transferase n=1 Tax=Nocardia brasiliensis TaxID=37326 RepID=UPI002455AA53|nr:leucyl/phenylalanyl-tRNA--protein transferase [Nocardia brasiliensis]
MSDAGDLMRMYLVDADQPFPSVELADSSGLVAFGGDLSPQRLLDAYSAGIFPWYNPGETIHWYCPDPRSILIPADLRVSRSYRRSVANADYAVTIDHAFADVMSQCAGPRDKEAGTWIGSDMQAAYLRLHHLGHAHSVEVWRDGELVGGLYGVARGRSFAGESMFSRARDTSKVALYWLRPTDRLGFRSHRLPSHLQPPHLPRRDRPPPYGLPAPAHAGRRPPRPRRPLAVRHPSPPLPQPFTGVSGTRHLYTLCRK